ncbi:TIGR00730 family Rossman fold protein [Candidatus Phycosocius spiralis]|uniref:Cytokinin riboside 5'-monophosphate phosphoribohydrolase n=1 Tax=Candidatus Phycosocius spiralis TaxID=2815099 RepID=A0ABQ4PYE1_9PROT|nr:TIGR00730 family Rossman fold protein [Candidatus Phycosocius spiralis]GIU68100.1 hypothetical protein PsB1_2254 [Candidatus Phycosocius spiralis]
MACLTSVCVYCGSSNQVDSSYLQLASDMGHAIAKRGIRLVYGGGNVGLMGASSRAALEAGGEVLGIMPHFLTKWEKPNPAIETRMVKTMHERKWGLFAESDAFIVLPGGIGTLEEVVETLSWQRLELHQKPVVLVGCTFWQPFVDLIEAIIAAKFTPAGFRHAFFCVETPTEALDHLQSVLSQRHWP